MGDVDWFVELLTSMANHNGGTLPVVQQPPVEPYIPKDTLPAYLYVRVSVSLVLGIPLRYAM